MSNEVTSGYVSLKWTTSRGRESYGWNICRLTDERDGWKFRATGGGYDMIGTVLGNWLVARFESRLVAIQDRAAAVYDHGTVTRNESPEKLYGFSVTNGRAMIDGACGTESVYKIADAIGVTLQAAYDRKGTRGYFWGVN